MNIILTLLVATAGAFVANKIKTPAPYMIGPLVAVGIFNVFTNLAYMPMEIKPFAQMITGIYIGKNLTKKDVKSLKDLFAPVIVLVLGYMCFTTITGIVIHFLYDVDYATAFLICVPGGIVDTSLMSYDLGGNPAMVSLIQTFRLSTVFIIFPPIINAMAKKHPVVKKEAIADFEDKETKLDQIIPDKEAVKQIFTVCVAVTGGMIGYVLDLPAGPLSMSMIFTAIMNINSHRIGLPIKYRRMAQIVSGCIIGSGIAMETILSIKDMILPALTVMAGYVIANFLISKAMALTNKIDRISAMFSTTPGGASEMALIASDVGGDTPRIAVLQVCRLISALTVYPYFIKLLVAIFA